MWDCWQPNWRFDICSAVTGAMDGTRRRISARVADRTVEGGVFADGFFAESANPVVAGVRGTVSQTISGHTSSSPRKAMTPRLAVEAIRRGDQRRGHPRLFDDAQHDLADPERPQVQSRRHSQSPRLSHPSETGQFVPWTNRTRAEHHTGDTTRFPMRLARACGSEGMTTTRKRVLSGMPAGCSTSVMVGALGWNALQDNTTVSSSWRTGMPVVQLRRYQPHSRIRTGNVDRLAGCRYRSAASHRLHSIAGPGPRGAAPAVSMMIPCLGWSGIRPGKNRKKSKSGTSAPMGFSATRSCRPRTFFYKPDFVPVGKDQLPHLELTRELARRFNGSYRPVFPGAAGTPH